MTVSPDLVILGGGIAGLVLARLQAAAGRRVRVIGRPRAPALEGLSPRVLEGLRRAGCAQAVAACTTAVPRVGQWNGRLSALNQEYIVERPVLDEALRADARAAGAEVVDARAPALDALPGGALVIEARGRQAPRPEAPRWTGPRTVALARIYDGGAGGSAESGVLAHADGWAWFAALPDGRRAVQVFLDAAEAPSRPEMEAAHARTIATVPDLAVWLGDAPPLGPVTAREATPLFIGTGGDGTGGEDDGAPLRLGDAAYAIDPLSGHGMYEAIGAALIAHPVVNTLLDRPDDAALARRFLDERARDAFHRHALVGRAFYAQEERWADRPFWRDRATWDEATLPAPPPPPPRPRVETRPVIMDGFVTERAVVATPQHPRGVYSIEDVPVAALLERLPGATGPEALAAALDRSPAQVVRALDWLGRQGLVSETA
ncbi:NAD(P)/FAD-dependent oxidoreductase [Novispirillum sp. DQ9]|uniref:flavin-dependent monooxygenase QhpG n=1 Tax=Novispirillum sp. DQ9 TaxID=3398612 RepID=UPI003C7B7E0F